MSAVNIAQYSLHFSFRQNKENIISHKLRKCINFKGNFINFSDFA